MRKSHVHAQANTCLPYRLMCTGIQCQLERVCEYFGWGRHYFNLARAHHADLFWEGTAECTQKTPFPRVENRPGQLPASSANLVCPALCVAYYNGFVQFADR